jgi:hypothetical protein
MPIVNATVHALYSRAFRNTAGSWPSIVYMSLLKSAPALDGSSLVEFTAADFVQYARQAITFGSPASRAMANSAPVLFASSATMGVPAVATHYGIHDALTSGNLMFWGQLTSPFSIGASSLVNFPIGQVTLTNIGTA